MKLHILGGAGESGRSCYLLEQKGSFILLDCGVKRSRNGAQAGEYPLLAPEHARQIKWMLLSHAHEDHCAAIPLLYRFGYRGKVYCADWTAAQSRRMFRNWGATVERFGGALPYGHNDLEQVAFAPMASLREDARGEALDVAAGRAGHLPGALWFLLQWHGKSLFYSGDFNLSSRLFSYDMPGTADVAILDAAYGEDGRTREDGEAQLLEYAATVIRRGGKVLLPLPQTGRGQEILAFLLEESRANNELRRCSWVIEQSIWEPLLTAVQDKDWCYPSAGLERIKDSIPPWIRIVSTDEERRRAAEERQPQLIFTTDGMMTNPLSSFWLEQVGAHSSNAIVLTGYQAPGTVGEQAAKGLLKLAAEVVNIRYKVHPNRQELWQMIEALQPRQVVLVHQSAERLRGVEAALRNKGIRAHLLSPGDQVCF